MFPYYGDLHIGVQGHPHDFILTSAGRLTVADVVNATGGFEDNGTAGIDWGPGDPSTITSMTVSGGIITAISTS